MRLTAAALRRIIEESLASGADIGALKAQAVRGEEGAAEVAIDAMIESGTSQRNAVLDLVRAALEPAVGERFLKDASGGMVAQRRHEDDETYLGYLDDLEDSTSRALKQLGAKYMHGGMRDLGAHRPMSSDHVYASPAGIRNLLVHVHLECNEQDYVAYGRSARVRRCKVMVT